MLSTLLILFTSLILQAYAHFDPISMSILYKNEETPQGAKVREKVYNTEYYSDHKLKKKEVSFKNGRLRYLFNDEIVPDTQDTDYLIVMDINKRVFIEESPILQKIHHSSLSRGEDVFFAGEVRVENGKILWLTNKSGHYRPGAKALLEFSHFLVPMNVLTQHSKGKNTSPYKPSLLEFATTKDEAPEESLRKMKLWHRLFCPEGCVFLETQSSITQIFRDHPYLIDNISKIGPEFATSFIRQTLRFEIDEVDEKTKQKTVQIIEELERRKLLTYLELGHFYWVNPHFDIDVAPCINNNLKEFL